MGTTITRTNSEEIQIDSNNFIDFPNGLPGFEDCKHFKLFHSEKSPVIFWLKSIDNPGVEFSLADPDLLNISYDLALTDQEQNTLKVESGDEMHTAVILSQQAENPGSVSSDIQANLKSPIVINVSKRVAMQKSFQNAGLSIHA